MDMSYDRNIKMFDEPHSPNTLDKVVEQKTINRGKFLTKAHSGSYQLQMQIIKNLKDVNTVLEIGHGEGYVARNLRSLGYDYHTLDFEGTHEPTIKADFRSFDASSVPQKYDMTCAFQVLEHFPYSDFKKHVIKLAELSSNYVFISLPYSCRGFSVDLTFQWGQNKRTQKRFDFYFATNLPNRKYREEYKKEYPWAVHYWEIGRKGFKLSKMLNDIESCGLKVMSRFHSTNPYHYLVLCKK